MPPHLEGSREASGPPRLVAMDEGSDILLDRPMVVVGRHPQCDTRLDSIRVSRRHCCLNPDPEGIAVRDLGSTNGIRINGRRVEVGRLHPGDELSIAHIRYRLVDGPMHEPTLADPPSSDSPPSSDDLPEPAKFPAVAKSSATTEGAQGTGDKVAAAVREAIPADLPDGLRIRVIIEHDPRLIPDAQERPAPCPPGSSP